MIFRDEQSLTSKAGFVAGQHYAIVTFSSITIPGDERSRTNPGHGYPEHVETTVHYTKYASKEAWQAEIERRMKSSFSYDRDFVPIIATVPVIETHVVVKVNET